MKDWEVTWSRNHFNLLALNATWAVPRSGLIFQKVSQDELALISVMPWMEEMGQAYKDGRDVPADAAALRKHQILDWETMAERFKAAGVRFTDPKGLLHD